MTPVRQRKTESINTDPWLHQDAASNLPQYNIYCYSIAALFNLHQHRGALPTEWYQKYQAFHRHFYNHEPIAIAPNFGSNNAPMEQRHCRLMDQEWNGIVQLQSSSEPEDRGWIRRWCQKIPVKRMGKRSPLQKPEDLEWNPWIASSTWNSTIFRDFICCNCHNRDITGEKNWLTCHCFLHLVYVHTKACREAESFNIICACHINTNLSHKTLQLVASFAVPFLFINIFMMHATHQSQCGCILLCMIMDWIWCNMQWILLWSYRMVSLKSQSRWSHRNLGRSRSRLVSRRAQSMMVNLDTPSVEQALRPLQDLAEVPKRSHTFVRLTESKTTIADYVGFPHHAHFKSWW